MQLKHKKEARKKEAHTDVYMYVCMYVCIQLKCNEGAGGREKHILMCECGPYVALWTTPIDTHTHTHTHMHTYLSF